MFHSAMEMDPKELMEGPPKGLISASYGMEEKDHNTIHLPLFSDLSSKYLVGVSGIEQNDRQEQTCHHKHENQS